MARQPSMNLCAETLEAAARLIEKGDFLRDLHPNGRNLRRKRQREDAALQQQARLDERQIMAGELRELSKRDDLTPAATLRRLADLPDREHVFYLREAWPLAADGLVKVRACLDCTSNSIPPESSYRITLTDKGRAVLATAELADRDPGLAAARADDRQEDMELQGGDGG